MKKTFLFLLFSIFITKLNAEIILDRVIIDFLPGQPTQQNINVSDNGKEVVYIQSEIFEILNAGMKNEKRVKVKKNEGNRLIVAPEKLTIQPNMKRRFQFIDETEDLEKDRIYRVTITPKVSGIETDSQIGIKLLVGYDVLVILRPKKLNYNVKVKKSKNDITFTNTGNTNILLDNIKQCDSKGKCEIILSDRLYVGNKKTVKLKYPNKPVYAEMYYGDDLKKHTY